ncbi:Putative Seipin family protein [Septoria linicola]|uniref:Seipin family protein n=1 Tax=Septoria linicola TaxID=215465 RepID=A0A9Q9ENJ7_9PEZI|nr:putative Seipin family protein [Septoria linicola]USW55548.1 Putative Seipin family protein [Septoria linicola]
MASSPRQKYLEDEEDARPQGLTAAIKSAILRPIQPFVSRTALRAYLTTFLVFSATFVLLALATTAYVLFYWSYIPRIGFERTIHLQFDNVYRPHEQLHRNVIARTKEHPYPYGSVDLSPELVRGQGYDVVVELDMPRTRENRDAGNFMLEVIMYAADDRKSAPSESIIDAARLVVTPSSAREDNGAVLAVARRPAIVPCRSWIVDWIHTAKSLPWYFFNLREEKDKLRIPVFEKAIFGKGRAGLPAVLHLEVQSTHRLQIYSAVAHFRARFTGLRWIMYNHRVVSALVFITAFWITELVFFGLAWGVVSFYISSPKNESDVKAELKDSASKLKQEEEETKSTLSDTERTFPTLAGQAPLRYSSPTNGIKQEEDDEEPALPPVTPAAEADDEDEDVDFFDSGIGTSMESSNPSRRDSMRRRRGRISDIPDADKAY